MPGVDVGGDTSVEWRVFVDNVRRSSIRNCSIGDTGFEQGGVDETDEGEAFTIGIKMPRQSEEFVKLLRAAAEDAARHAGEPGYLVRFLLPIEPQNPTQIQIRWKSSAVTSPRKAAKPSMKSGKKAAAPRKRGR